MQSKFLFLSLVNWSYATKFGPRAKTRTQCPPMICLGTKPEQMGELYAPYWNHSTLNLDDDLGQIHCENRSNGNSTDYHVTNPRLNLLWAKRTK